MAKYMTRQRRAIRQFLAAHPDEMLSAQRIADGLGGDCPVSASAVYRNLAEMEREGVVRRVSKAGSRETYFRYLAAEPCRESLHLSCKRCGRTYHMCDRGAEELIRAVTQSEHFTLDKAETVLYGVCGACQTAK